MNRIALLCLAFGATACQPLEPAAPPADPRVAAGLALAQGSCSGCHSVERYTESSNPDSPSFARIVNREGLTAETLSSWLRDAHNYPREMDFALDQRKIDDLVAYMLTLRDPNYRPPI